MSRNRGLFRTGGMKPGGRRKIWNGKNNKNGPNFKKSGKKKGWNKKKNKNNTKKKNKNKNRNKKNNKKMSKNKNKNRRYFNRRGIKQIKPKKLA